MMLKPRLPGLCLATRLVFTLFILDQIKEVLWQTVRTQMKCRIIFNFQGRKKTSFFLQNFDPINNKADNYLLVVSLEMVQSIR